MKKSLFALAAVTAFAGAAQAQSSVTVYGILDVGYVGGNAKATAAGKNSAETVSGIGPKVAQSALSIYEPEELASAIASENSAALERIPGLGKKGAQRTVLELKDKVSDLARTQSSGSSAHSHWRSQLQSALIGLGFTARDAESTIDVVASDLGTKVDQTDISQLLKLALQTRGRG
jgi:Holliday junction DNA helicase RuvA